MFLIFEDVSLNISDVVSRSRPVWCCAEVIASSYMFSISEWYSCSAIRGSKDSGKCLTDSISHMSQGFKLSLK